jgi:hypothetical protein
MTILGVQMLVVLPVGARVKLSKRAHVAIVARPSDHGFNVIFFKAPCPMCQMRGYGAPKIA